MSAPIQVLVYLGFAAWVLFVATYHVRARWWESPIGRNVMGTAVGLAAVMGLIAAQITWPDYALRPALQGVVYSSLIFLGVQRTVQMLRVQSQHHPHPIPEEVPLMGRYAAPTTDLPLWRRLLTLEPAVVRGVIGAVVAIGLLWGVDLTPWGDRLADTADILAGLVLLLTTWWVRSGVTPAASVVAKVDPKSGDVVDGPAADAIPLLREQD